MKGIYPDIMVRETDDEVGTLMTVGSYIKHPNGKWSEAKSSHYVKTRFFEKFKTKQEIFDEYNRAVANLSKYALNGKHIFLESEVENLITLDDFYGYVNSDTK